MSNFLQQCGILVPLSLNKFVVSTHLDCLCIIASFQANKTCSMRNVNSAHLKTKVEYRQEEIEQE